MSSEMASELAAVRALRVRRPTARSDRHTGNSVTGVEYERHPSESRPFGAIRLRGRWRIFVQTADHTCLATKQRIVQLIFVLSFTR